MQHTQYDNAPLLELIAELRWGEAMQPQVGAPINLAFPSVSGSEQEDFYTKLASALQELDFNYMERLLPPGLAAAPGQVALRLRERAGTVPLIQAGPGILTVNGLPPTYSTWKAFSRVLGRTIDAVKGLDVLEQDSPLRMQLRYINAFGPMLWDEREPDEFISQILGLEVALPASALSQRAPDTSVSSVIQSRVSLPDAGTLSIDAGRGVANNLDSVILNLAVERNVDGIELLFDSFQSAHRIIHEVFEEMTLQIHDAMGPKNE